MDINKIDLFDKVEDFPKQGVTFYDVRGLLRRPTLWKEAIEDVAGTIKELEIDKIFAPDARSFLFAAPICLELNLPLVMGRKAGKLPPPVLANAYSTEYGEDSIEVGEYDITPEDRVLLFDDVLATGGTLASMKELCRLQGNTPIAAVVMLELPGLRGKDQLGIPVYSWTQAA